MILLARGRRKMALKVILDFDTYMRPGESLEMLKKHFVEPVPGTGPQYQWHSVIVKDFDD